MKHYKKPDGSIWAFEIDGSQDAYITADMALVSDAELAVLRAPPPPDPNLPHLAVLAAADAPFTPRRMREFMRAVLEDKAQAVATANSLTLAQVEAMNPAYQFVKQMDDAAIAARALLTPAQS